MRKHLCAVFCFPLRLAAFWLLFFAVFRVWFILWFRSEWPEQDGSSVWKSLWYAMPLDLSMAGYLLAVPVLLWFAGLSMRGRYRLFVERAITVFNTALMALMVLVFGANIFIYEEWHTLLNNRALEYLSTPRAMLDSMSVPFRIASVALYLFFVWAMWRLYTRIAGRQVYGTEVSLRSYFALPVLTGGLFLAIRGGFGVMPVNESAVYYSAHLFCNHAATNTAWNLFHSLIETRSTENHYRFMEDGAAALRVKKLFPALNDEAPRLLSASSDSARANIMFIVMESMTARVVEELGGAPGVCPNLGRLIREGVLFDRVYSSGYRTDQGLVSILAGYPAQPDQSIVLLSDKAEKLPSIPKLLHGQGYSTAFFYGGELTFANIGQWLTNQRFETILSEKDFTRAEKTQRWGVDDHILLQRVALETGKLPQPFFVTAMTLSLHPPFDVPYNSRWSGTDEREKFLNSAAFADHAIGEFFRVAEQQPWYANTLFLLVADHGSSNPGRIGLDNPASRHVPLILFGQPLAADWSGKRITAVGNHHDIPATLLPQFGYSAAAFEWSRNLLSTGAQQGGEGFAFYTNENGLGWVAPGGKAFYEFGKGEWITWSGKADTIRQRDAEAYLQTLYNDFLKK